MPYEALQLRLNHLKSVLKVQQVLLEEHRRLKEIRRFLVDVSRTARHQRGLLRQGQSRPN